MDEITDYIATFRGKESGYINDLMEELSCMSSQTEANNIGKKYHCDISFYSDIQGSLQCVYHVSVKSKLIFNVQLTYVMESGICRGSHLLSYDFDTYLPENVVMLKLIEKNFYI